MSVAGTSVADLHQAFGPGPSTCTHSREPKWSVPKRLLVSLVKRQPGHCLSHQVSASTRFGKCCASPTRLPSRPHPFYSSGTIVVPVLGDHTNGCVFGSAMGWFAASIPTVPGFLLPATLAEHVQGWSVPLSLHLATDKRWGHRRHAEWEIWRHTFGGCSNIVC